MSTPISRNSKLEGLELYAPRRATQSPAADNGSSPSQAQPQGQESGAPDGENDDRSPADTVSAQAAEARLNDAIEAIIEVERSLDAEQPFADEPQLPPAANLRLQPGANTDWPLHRRDDFHAATSYRSRLDPEIVPEPPADPRRSALIPVLLAIAFAAVVAYGVTAISWPQSVTQQANPATDRVATVAPEPAPSPQSRLVVEDQQAFANEPLALGVSVNNAITDETLRLAGLAEGTRLSAGERADDFSWRLRLHELQGLYLYAPTNFVGVMHTGIDLIAPDHRVLDRRGVRLEWLVKKKNPTQVGKQADTDKSGAIGYQTMSQEEAATLMKRAEDFLNSGDITAARILFMRLADAGIADGAFAAANSYDPRYLAQNHVVGMQGDEAKARALYQRAMQLGSTEAGRALAQMSAK
jgi:hypothetical protein